MAIYKNIIEAFNAIGYGLCSICEAEHEFPDIKCDLMTLNREGE